MLYQLSYTPAAGRAPYPAGRGLASVSLGSDLSAGL